MKLLAWIRRIRTSPRLLKFLADHAVTELIQTATKARIKGDTTAERAALQRAAELRPAIFRWQSICARWPMMPPRLSQNPFMRRTPNRSLPLRRSSPSDGKKSFHLQRIAVEQLRTFFHSFGIEASVDSSVTGPPVRFEMDDSTFAQAMRAINMVTDTFTVPLDAHRAIVAKDTRENRDHTCAGIESCMAACPSGECPTLATWRRPVSRRSSPFD